MRLELKVLRGFPKIVEHEQPIFVGQFVKNLLGVLPEPVSDDIEVGFAVQPKIRFEALPRNSLARIVHSPAAATRRYRRAVDSNHEERRERLRRDIADRRRILARGRQRLCPPIRHLFDGFMPGIYETDARGGRRIDLNPTQPAMRIE